VLLSGLTTLIGFGSLALIGSFASIASIGEVLGLGIAAALCAALFVLPAILGRGSRGSGSRGRSDASPAGSAADRHVTDTIHDYRKEVSHE
jgi:predicted RND superfamily exporter protein